MLKKPTIVITILVLALLMFAGELGAKATWKSFQARSYKEKATLVVEGKTCEYYLADSETPVETVVTGPARVKILTRLDMKSLPEDEAFYELAIWMDDQELDPVEKSTHASELAEVTPDESAVGVIRRIYLDVPKGTHVYRLAPVGKGTGVYFRFFRGEDEKKRRLVALTPSSRTTALTALYDEKEISYHMLDKSRPVILDLNGPTN